MPRSRGAKDGLRGLKENVIIGKLIPVGTGFETRRRAIEATHGEALDEYEEEEAEEEAELADEDLLFENEDVLDLSEILGENDEGADFTDELDLAA